MSAYRGNRQAVPWSILRDKVFPASYANTSSAQLGKAYVGRLPQRIENLNALASSSRIPRSKSGVKQSADGSLQASVQLDYSDTYRENDALEGDLEDQLDGLKRIQKRQLLEKGEELKQIRKQVEVITRLQEAVKSRKGSSARLVASRSSTRSNIFCNGTPAARGRGRGRGVVSRQASRATIATGQDGVDGKTSADGDIDFGSLAQATRTQMRIAAEREKYSAKNLFNVRRPKTAIGNYRGAVEEPAAASAQKRFFAGPSTTSTVFGVVADQDRDGSRDRDSDESDDSETGHAASRAIISVEINDKNNNKQRPPSSASGSRANGHSNHAEPTDREVNTPTANSRAPSRGILRPTTALAGRDQTWGDGISEYNGTTTAKGPVTFTNPGKPRPKTALGLVPTHDELSDGSGSRPQTGRRRSRSRRELELLCRMMEPDDDNETSVGGGVSIADINQEAELINEKKRRRKLRALRQESQKLEVKVKDFLSEIDGFNKKQAAAKSASSASRKKSFTGIPLMISDLD